MIDADPANDPRIAQVLAEGEEIVWIGRPSRNYLRRRAWRSCLCAVPGVLFLSGFAIFFSSFYTMPLSIKDSLGVWLLFGVLIGFQVLLLLAPLWYPWRFSGTRYVVTNKRCVIHGPVPGSHTLHGCRSVRSWYRADLQSLTRVEDRKGFGHLRFERITGREGASRGGKATKRCVDGFMGLEDPAGVERLIRQNLYRLPSETADQ